MSERYQQEMERLRTLVDEELERALPAGNAEEVAETPIPGKMPTLLRLSMRYSLTSGGKRLRPILALATAELLGADAKEALPYACAVELIHTYSLIHDDLPALDNDTLRRGRPTNHMVFGEGISIIAGDGLQALAHEWMLETQPSPERLRAHWLAMREITKGSGVTGIVGGQTLDIAWERREKSKEVLDAIHFGKTASLFIAPIRAGARIGDATEEEMEALTQYGTHMGMAFQITDDILDVTGSAAAMGKDTGSDARENKLTYVTLYGVEPSRKMALREVEAAEASLERFGEKAWLLKEIVRRLLTRKS